MQFPPLPCHLLCLQTHCFLSASIFPSVKWVSAAALLGYLWELYCLQHFVNQRCCLKKKKQQNCWHGMANKMFLWELKSGFKSICVLSTLMHTILSSSSSSPIQGQTDGYMPNFPFFNVAKQLAVFYASRLVLSTPNRTGRRLVFL